MVVVVLLKVVLLLMMTPMQVGPGDDYRLTVGGFNDALSTLGDSMAYSNGRQFGTK